MIGRQLERRRALVLAGALALLAWPGRGDAALPAICTTTRPCAFASVSSDPRGFHGTSARDAFDGSLLTYFRAEGRGQEQTITIDLGCTSAVRSVTRYMSRYGNTSDAYGDRGANDELFSFWDGVSYVTTPGGPTPQYVSAIPSNSTGWEGYTFSGGRFQNVSYAWSRRLVLSTPLTARYVRFTWKDSAEPSWDALHEIVIESAPGVPGAADIAVTVTGPAVVPIGSPSFDNVVTVTNCGPEPATGVRLSVVDAWAYTWSIPKPMLTNPSQGFCFVAPGGDCDLGALSSGSSATARWRTGFTNFPGEENVELRASASEPDSLPGNNVHRNTISFIRCSIESEKACFLNWLSKVICQARTPTAGRLRALASAVYQIDLPLFRRLRGEVLAKSAAGRRYKELYATHSAELVRLSLANPALAAGALATLGLWEPSVRDLVAGKGDRSFLSAAQVSSLTAFLAEVKRLGSPALRETIAREEAALDLPSLADHTMDEALDRLRRTDPGTITLPSAASIHGVAPTFFHSDARVFNPSLTASASVTARYRCFTGSCPDAERTLTLAAREVKAFDDVVATLFGAPESAGPVEWTGPVLVDSRVYTPSRPAPTSGLYVPGLPADEAYQEAVILSLSHSKDRLRGFRTNAGAYNPNDVPLTVTFALHHPSGAPIGTSTRQLASRAAVQVNDVFADAGVTSDVENAYCVVRADGVHPLFAYATVIDNLSQDAIFVAGRNSRGALGVVTLPAAASIHGIAPAFFHSDARVFNPSFTDTATVIARYRCFTGTCDGADRTFTVGPREMKVFDDVVATLFGAPESAGPIELTGDVLVDSRVYTPSRPSPTTGLHVPGLRETEAYPEAVLTSLSHSADRSKGFRTNGGVYNPSGVALTASFILFDPGGREIGRTTRDVAAHTAVQVNDLFASSGISTSVENAYCIVRGDGVHGVFAYATVIDNQSQDGIFVAGRALSAP